MTVIIDYGLGNKSSILRVFDRLKSSTKLSSDPLEILAADKIILPGVGHFSQGMKNLEEMGLISVLNEAVLVKKIPVLGICLGMQLMTNFSEEGNIKGLGWVNAETLKIKTSLKIPHVGWNTLNIKNSNSILKNITETDQFYFVHSYSIHCNEAQDVLSTTLYSEDPKSFGFVSSFQKGNIFGTQFHPEKSHSQGLKIIQNFINV